MNLCLFKWLRPSSNLFNKLNPVKLETLQKVAVKALKFKKHQNIWVLREKIKTCTRRISNTLEIHSRLLDFLILLVAVDIHLNMCPGLFCKAHHIGAILLLRSWLVWFYFPTNLLKAGVMKKYKIVKCKIQNSVYLVIASL